MTLKKLKICMFFGVLPFIAALFVVLCFAMKLAYNSFERYVKMLTISTLLVFKNIKSFFSLTQFCSFFVLLLSLINGRSFAL